MKQKIALERAYQANPYPDVESREKLCEDLGMNSRKADTSLHQAVTKLIKGASLVSKPSIQSQNFK